ncbi:TPA: Vir protein [Legionella pneumophila]|nr:Vir protein [Legionella pneumophila]HAT8332580.1 Vir protein [Legionella pneumophila]
MSSPCSATNEKRIDLLFSKFAAFYGHIWRSQFKDDVFLKFAKKEWQEGLEQFGDGVLNEAIVLCRTFYELPPTLPQMIHLCREIRKRKNFRIKLEHVRARETVVASHIKQCKELLA